MANSVYGPVRVASLRMAHDGSVYVELDPAPAACMGGADYRMHAKVDATAANHDELMATLLSAYTSDASFRFVWLSNDTGEPCSTTHVLDLYMVEMAPK
jgi:hypothetical protein